MRKFVFSSKDKTFDGSFFIVYNEREELQELNFQDANLSTERRLWLLRHCPESLDVEQLRAFVSATRTDAIESTLTFSFEDFWNKYGKKINRKRCEPLFAKLSESNRTNAVLGIAKYDKYLKVQSWRTKADPESYLRNEMWNNDWN